MGSPSPCFPSVPLQIIVIFVPGRIIGPGFIVIFPFIFFHSGTLKKYNKNNNKPDLKINY